MTQTKARNSEERLWATLCHLTAVAGLVIGPLAIWLLKRNSHPFVDDQGRESLDFQISILVYMASLSGLTVAAAKLSLLVVVPLYLPILLIVGGLLVVDLILVVVASASARTGRPFRYPLSIRFVRQARPAGADTPDA